MKIDEEAAHAMRKLFVEREPLLGIQPTGMKTRETIV
jgi:hypothetical protein